MCAAFDIKGPSQAGIECSDNEDGSAVVTYCPIADGEYAVHVLFDGQDVHGSPFMATIEPLVNTFDPLQVRFTAVYSACQLMAVEYVLTTASRL
jgi:Filamin/ABP280 repeat